MPLLSNCNAALFWWKKHPSGVVLGEIVEDNSILQDVHNALCDQISSFTHAFGNNSSGMSVHFC